MSSPRQRKPKTSSRDYPSVPKLFKSPTEGLVTISSTFGRAKRETVCSCEVVMEPSLSQALHLLNGDTTNTRIRQGKVVESSLKDGKKPDQIIDELYLRCYSRKPLRKKPTYWHR